MCLCLTLHSTITEFVTVSAIKTIHPVVKLIIKLIVLAITIILYIGLCESVSVHTQ